MKNSGISADVQDHLRFPGRGQALAETFSELKFRVVVYEAFEAEGTRQLAPVPIALPEQNRSHRRAEVRACNLQHLLEHSADLAGGKFGVEHTQECGEFARLGIEICARHGNECCRFQNVEDGSDFFKSSAEQSAQVRFAQ